MARHGSRCWPSSGWRPGRWPRRSGRRRPRSRSPTPSACWPTRSRSGSGIWLCLLLGRSMLLALAPLAAAGAVVAVATLIALWIGDNAGEFFEEDATLRYPARLSQRRGRLLRGRPVADARAGGGARSRLAGARRVAGGGDPLDRARSALAEPSRRLRRGGRRRRAGRRPPRAAADARLHAARGPARGSGAPLAAGRVPARRGRDRGLDSAAAHRLRGDGGDLGGRVRAGGDRRPNRPTTLARRGEARQRGPLGRPRRWCCVAAAVGWRAPTAAPPASSTTTSTSSPPPTSARRAAVSGSTCARVGGTSGGWPSTISRPTRSPAGGPARSAASYLLDRESDATDVQPEDPHSVEMLMASELGVPGLVLFAAFVRRRPDRGAARPPPGAVGRRPRRRRRSPPGPTGWCRPRSTGSGTTRRSRCRSPSRSGPPRPPALLRPPGPPRRGRRLVLAAVCVLAAAGAWCRSSSASATPREAWSEGRDDPDQAYSELREGRRPESPQRPAPCCTRRSVADEAGEPQRALAALSEAQQRTPTSGPCTAWRRGSSS